TPISTFNILPRSMTRPTPGPKKSLNDLELKYPILVFRCQGRGLSYLPLSYLPLNDDTGLYPLPQESVVKKANHN
ncbi:MAG: hypothetical protein ABW138_01400, partial [Candidatus Thiodiazotropha sp. 4PDIVS1]